MTAKELIPGRIYKMVAGDFVEFSRIGGAGHVIFHPPDEPDMQSSFATRADTVEREATPEEAQRCRNDA